MKTALVIRHTPVEGVAGFRAPIEAAGYAIDRIDVTDPAFPDQDFISPDLLVMMGGPMAVYERAEHPWIAHEIERIARIDFVLEIKENDVLGVGARQHILPRCRSNALHRLQI